MKAPGFLWIMRALWLVLPFTLLEAVVDATSDASTAVSTTSQSLFWVLWALTALLMLVPLPSTLTALRITAPIAPAASLCAAVAAAPDAAAWAGLAAGTIVAVLCMGSGVGDWYIDGSSYGDERRFALRAPAALVMLAAPLAWLLTVTPLLSGIMLFAGELWLVGGLLIVFGIVTSWWGSFALWRLARRWVVFVPAGMTLVDEMALAEPVLFPARAITNIGPAHVGTEATDLTVGAPGLVIEAELAAPVELLPAVGRAGETEAVAVGSILMVPSRPAAMLDHAEGRGLTVRRS